VEETTTWKKKDRMITFVLLGTIDSSIKPIISAYSTGTAQWKALCDKYDKQNDTSLHALVKNTITLKCNSKNGLPEHITQFDQLWPRFMQRTAGASTDTLESDWATVSNSPRAKASILFASLPSSPDNVVDNLTGLTHGDVTNRLTDLVSVKKSRKK
jgi:hypothetical protein